MSVLWLDRQSQPASSCAARSFGQVAQTVTLINRFRSRAQRRYIAFGQCFVEPIVRHSNHGNRYWSILEEENSQFLDRLGYYLKGPRRTSMLKADSTASVPVAKRSGWASIKASAITKPPVLDIPTRSDQKSPSLAVSAAGNGQKSPNRSPRTSDAGLFQDGVDANNPLPVPSRFMARRSTYVAPEEPIVRPQFDFSGTEQKFRIPTIEINNNKTDRVLSRHSDHSGFEWYHSSSFGSSTTSASDDLTTPSSVDSYLNRLEEIRSARLASSMEEDGMDRLFVRVSSDAASTVSTLVEGNGSGCFEATGADATATDQTTTPDTHAERQQRLTEPQHLAPDSFEIEEVRSEYIM